MAELVVSMDREIAFIEFALAAGFIAFGFQRWQMGHRAASMMCFVLSTYFGRIAMLYTGRAWDKPYLERAVEPTAIFMNALLLLLALVMAIVEAHEIGFAEWLERWKERRR